MAVAWWLIRITTPPNKMFNWSAFQNWVSKFNKLVKLSIEGRCFFYSDATLSSVRKELYFRSTLIMIEAKTEKKVSSARSHENSWEPCRDQDSNTTRSTNHYTITAEQADL